MEINVKCYQLGLMKDIYWMPTSYVGITHQKTIYKITLPCSKNYIQHLLLFSVFPP